jgi:two-component system sensor histidine kinase KdpD
MAGYSVTTIQHRLQGSASSSIIGAEMVPLDNLGGKFIRGVLVTMLAFTVVALYRLVFHVNQTTVALTFIVLVLAVASRWPLVYSIYLSVLCTLLYNFFFLPPLGTFTITDPQNWIALVAFLGASIIVSHLAEREHSQGILSEHRREEVERLYEFSQQMLLQDDLSELARNVPRLIAKVFHLGSAALFVQGQKAAYYSDPADEIVSMTELELAASSPDAARSAMPGIRLVPLMLGLRPMGALAMREGNYSDGMYVAISGLVAIAVERASAVERFSRIEAARENERLRTALLDSVTHELRTPLTAIRAAATSLSSQSSLVESERQEMIAIVDEESARLDRLIGQAMEMAQLDAQAIKVNRKIQSVADVFEQVLEDSRPVLGEHTVVVEGVDNIPPLLFDRELVRRVIRHLIENAAKYSPPGTAIQVIAEFEGARLSVEVMDKGHGIDEADRPFIFDKFYRGRGLRKRVQGTGMGLAIARALVAAHGGAIELTSRPEQGTAFTFWIPVETTVALEKTQSKSAEN